MKPLHFQPPFNDSAPLPRTSVPWFARWKYAPVYAYFVAAAFFVFTIRTPQEPIGPLLINNLWYFSVPLAVLVFGVTYQHRFFLYRTKKKPYQAWFQSLFVYLFALFLIFPYELAWNATASHPQVINLHGPVIRMHVSHGRSTSYNVTIDDQTLHRPLTFDVSRSDYQMIDIGEEYSERMRVGRLGIPYRWRWENP